MKQPKANWPLKVVYVIIQEILLDCDQFNVFFARIIFSCILLSAFSFLSTCIRDLASIWDRTNIILIVTGVEVVIGNCLPFYLAQLRRYGASKIMGSRPWPFGVTWPFNSRRTTSYGWSTVTMRLSSSVTEIWPFEVLPERLFQEQKPVVGRRSVLNITLFSYTPLHISRKE